MNMLRMRSTLCYVYNILNIFAVKVASILEELKDYRTNFFV